MTHTHTLTTKVGETKLTKIDDVNGTDHVLFEVAETSDQFVAGEEIFISLSDSGLRVA
jgi:hypothetical protein